MSFKASGVNSVLRKKMSSFVPSTIQFFNTTAFYELGIHSKLSMAKLLDQARGVIEQSDMEEPLKLRMCTAFERHMASISDKCEGLGSDTLVRRQCGIEKREFSSRIGVEGQLMVLSMKLMDILLDCHSDMEDISKYQLCQAFAKEEQFGDVPEWAFEGASIYSEKQLRAQATTLGEVTDGVDLGSNFLFLPDRGKVSGDTVLAQMASLLKNCSSSNTGMVVYTQFLLLAYSLRVWLDMSPIDYGAMALPSKRGNGKTIPTQFKICKNLFRAMAYGPLGLFPLTATSKVTEGQAFRHALSGKHGARCTFEFLANRRLWKAVLGMALSQRIEDVNMGLVTALADIKDLLGRFPLQFGGEGLDATRATPGLVRYPDPNMELEDITWTVTSAQEEDVEMEHLQTWSGREEHDEEDVVMKDLQTRKGGEVREGEEEEEEEEEEEQVEEVVGKGEGREQVDEEGGEERREVVEEQQVTTQSKERPAKRRSLPSHSYHGRVVRKSERGHGKKSDDGKVEEFATGLTKLCDGKMDLMLKALNKVLEQNQMALGWNPAKRRFEDPAQDLPQKRHKPLDVAEPVAPSLSLPNPDIQSSLSDRGFVTDENGEEILLQLKIKVPLVSPELQVEFFDVRFFGRNHSRLTGPRGDYARLVALLDKCFRFWTESGGQQGISYTTQEGWNAMEDREKLEKIKSGPVVIKDPRQLFDKNSHPSPQEFFQVEGSHGKSAEACTDALAGLGVSKRRRHVMQDLTKRPIVEDGHAERVKVPHPWAPRASRDDINPIFVKGRLDSILTNKAGVLNCLDLKQKTLHPTCMQRQLSHSPRSNDCLEELGFKSSKPDLGFCLLGKSSAFSRYHIDGDGVATAVRINSGSKLWFFMCDSKVRPLSLVSNSKRWCSDDCQWTAVFLKAGDEIIMPPGTPHAVLTVEDSVSSGGMYYLPGMYQRSLETLIELHLHGQSLTNSDYPGASIHLFHLVGHYHSLLESENWNSADGVEAKRVYGELESEGELPPPLDLAALCLAVEHSDSMTPQQQERTHQVYPLHYKRDRGVAQKLALGLKSKLLEVELVPAHDYEVLEKMLGRLESRNANRRQRDLEEVGEGEAGSSFYQDNEDEFFHRRGDPDCPWEGERPVVPKDFDNVPEDLVDPAFPEEYSDEEVFPELDESFVQTILP